MNKTQLQSTLAPAIAAIAGFLAGKGYFGWDAQTWIAILGGAGTLVATVWGAWATRETSLKDTVGGLPKTTVVTDAASAAALPNNPDVVASTPELVQAINKAKV